jgi:hypothetical protein
MLLRLFAAAALVILSCFSAVPASAHFKLLKPTSWLTEDSTGGPQKGSPCGPGNSGFLGDDVQPVPTSGMVTEFHAGEMIDIDLQETIPHPGYFRIAFAKDRSQFTIPPVDNPTSCALDLDKVPTGAHDNILADGMWKEPSQPSARHLMTKVKLPDEPCDKCTIQVVQVMKDHGASSCYYYHCADIKILPAAGGAAGSGGAAAAGASGSAGMSTAGSTAGAAAGAGGASGSAAGSMASATAGTSASGTTGAAGATSGAGRVASPSGGAGSAAGGTGAAGQGTTTSAMSAAGATGAAGGTPMMAAPVASDSGCSITAARASSNSLAARAGFALFAVAFVLRARRRRASR